MTLRCENCNQTILPTDTVCWHCGKELESQQTGAVDTQEMVKSTLPNEEMPISLTAVSVFALITLITIVLFIVVTNLLAHYSGG